MRRNRARVFCFSIRKRRKFFVFFSVLFIIFFLTAVYFSRLVNPLLISTSESKIKVVANKSMNIAVTRAMEQNIRYDDLIHIVTDSSGKISLIQADSVQINALSKLIASITQENLMKLAVAPIEIPLGAFTGITIISNIGPKVSVNLTPFGDISCKFTSEFISAGINQTQHRIYLNISTFVTVVLPFDKITVNSKSDVLLCESVIIGDIPETYLNASTLDNMLDLVPRK
ncbi:MAG: sporulation protein YunB [Clostridia bacterium]